MKKELIEKNPLLKLSFEFSILILEYCDSLDQLRRYTISKQLSRSGTSIGANAMEAQNGESKADETQYWITLCEFANGYPDTNIISNKLIELQKIINAILGTAKRKTPFSYILSFFIF